MPGDEHAALLQEILSLERRLVERQDPDLVHLIDPDFREIGRSGRIWRRDDVVPDLAGTPLEAVTLQDAEISEPIPGLALLTYLAITNSRRTRRASLWRRDEGAWRLLYHQGTDLLP